MRKITVSTLCGLGLAVIAMAWTPMARAQGDATWDNDSLGSFGTAGNWDTSQVPDGNATFGPDDGDYEVYLDDNYTVGQLFFTEGNTDVGGTVNLNLAFRTLTTDDSTSGSAMLIDPAGTANRTVEVTGLGAGGTLDLSTNVIVGDSTGTGTAILDVGNTATVNINGGGGETTWIGRNSSGQLYVRSGGTVNISNPTTTTSHYISGPSGTAGLVHVEGGTMNVTNTAGQLLRFGIGGYSTLGGLGNGTLKVTDGGRFFTNTPTLVYAGASAYTGRWGVLEVSGANSTAEIGRLRVAYNNSGGNGTVKISDGGTLTTSNSSTATAGAVFYERSILEIDGGELDVTSNATFEDGASIGSTVKLTLNDTADTPISVGTNLLLETDGAGVTFELSLADGLKPKVDDVFTVAEYGTLTGTFAGLADGDTITDSQTGAEFEIYYDGYGGSYDDQIVLLTTIPEPHSLGMILLGLASIGLRRYRSRRFE